MGSVMSGVCRLCPLATCSCTTVNAVHGAEPHCSPVSIGVACEVPAVNHYNVAVCTYQYSIRDEHRAAIRGYGPV